MKAYLTMTLTDMFGDVPYFEAFSGRSTGVTTPKYDAQEDIYLNENGILDNLDKAVVAMESYAGAIALRGDILYDGDLSLWIRFANSLKLKALLRIVETDSNDALAEISSLVGSGNLIEGNAQNAVFESMVSTPVAPSRRTTLLVLVESGAKTPENSILTS